MKRGGQGLLERPKPAGAAERRGASGAPPPVEWGTAARTLAGQAVSGDRALVRVAGPLALAAVVDGVGHGAAAAAAAEIAVGVLAAHSTEAPAALVARCDAALRATRGVVMSVALFDAARDLLVWAGVGNVEGVLLRWQGRNGRDAETLLCRAGVLGTRREQPLAVQSVALGHGDTLVLATDGVRTGFELGLSPDGEPRRIAERILGAGASASDDALVLVVRYLGRTGVRPSVPPSPRVSQVSGTWPRFVPEP